MCFDLFHSFFGHFLASLSPSDTPDVSVSLPVGTTSQLAAALLSPSSSMLRGLFCDLAGLLGDGARFLWYVLIVL